MSTGDSFLSRRANLYDTILYNLYLERFDYWRDRDVQIINLFSISPMKMKTLKQIDLVHEDTVKEKLRDYLGIPDYLNMLILPDRFSAYYTLLFSITDLNDEILTPSPIPYFLNQYTHPLGSHVVNLETNMVDDYDLPFRKDIEDRITARSRLFYFSSPGFSGGVTYPEETLERILFICRNYHLYIAIDETLSHLVIDRDKYVSMHDIALESERLIRIASPLKDFSMNGITVLIFHDNLPQKIELISEDLFNVSPYQISYLNHFLENNNSLKKERLEELRYKKRIIDIFVEDREDVSASIPGSFGSIFLRLPVPNTEAFIEWLLTEYNRDRKTVFVAPATNLHSEYYEDNGEILIDYRYLDSEMLEEGLELLSDALDIFLGLNKE